MQNLRSSIHNKPYSHFGAFLNKCTKGKKSHLKSDAGAYLFSINCKEKINEINGAGNDLDFGARVYDARLGRFLSLDPRTNDFSFWAPYIYAANNPVRLIDIEGECPGDLIAQNYNRTGYVMIILLDNSSADFNLERQKEIALGWDF
ncbi:MAG: hypothetical protein K9I36_07330 [Bacteroidia bacterium]|nr:hypothetical protein [Bacteroidia bacterium]MCF8426527.1 hypothetical protein [Bacteroidia bacterium]